MCGFSASETSTTGGGLGFGFGFCFAGGEGGAGAAVDAFPGGGGGVLRSDGTVSSKRMKCSAMRQMVKIRICFHCICWTVLRACSVLKSENIVIVVVEVLYARTRSTQKKKVHNPSK